MKRERRGREEIVFIGDDNSDLAPILQYPTVVGVVAGLDAKSARTIRREPGVNLWRAADGFVKRTSVARGAYVLEDFREMITLLEWDTALKNETMPSPKKKYRKESKGGRGY